MSDLAPNTNNYTKGGATVFFQRTGTTGYIDLGNIPTFNQSATSQYLEHRTARSGKSILDRRDETQSDYGLTIALDELNSSNLALILKSNPPVAFSQASGTAATKQIVAPTLGMSYSLDAFRLTSVVVKVGATTKTLGTDYSLESDVGMITILPGGTILATDTVDITFDKPAITGNVVNPQSKTEMITGAVKLRYRTSDGRMWVFEHSKVTMSFSGDMTMAGTEYAQASATMNFEPDYTKSEAERYGKITMLPPAA